MLIEYFLIAWIGTTTNFQILERHFTIESCQESRKVWLATMNNHINLTCISDFREGRSQYPKSGMGIEGVAK
jgi:hypothetical protein